MVEAYLSSNLQANPMRENRDMNYSLRTIKWACPPGCLEQIKTARQDGSTTAPTFFRELNAFLIMLKFSDSYETYRICSQQYLQSIWIVFGCMGCWGVGWGVPNPSRRIHDGFTTDQDWPGQTHLSVCNWMMLEYSDSYETYRICSQQYLHSIWIVFGCMGCWGVGWGVPNPSRRTHDGPGQMHLSTYLMMLEYSDSYETRQLWNLQDMFTTIFTFDLNSFWVYGVLAMEMNWVVRGSNIWWIITADQPSYAAEIASPETAGSFHDSIQYQLDTPGDILQLVQSVVGSLR